MNARINKQDIFYKIFNANKGTFKGKTVESATGKQTPTTQPEPQTPQTDAEKRIAFFLPQQLQGGEIEVVGKIGEGGTGVIYKGILKLPNRECIDVIIKELSESARNDDFRKDDIKNETQISSDIRQNAIANINKNDNLLSSQEGFTKIVFQQEINGKHVQIFIAGCNGHDAIRENKLDLYNTETGRPKNIEQPLMLAQQFLNSIHALHEQGFAHGDIKLENIILSNNQERSNEYNCTLIDLGISGRSGEARIADLSYNAAPEVKNGNILFTNQDIYAAGTVSCEIFFGKNNNTWFDYFRSTVHNKQISANAEEHAKNLRSMLQAANTLPDGSMLYPPAIFNAISDLIVRMCAINPAERPSSQYCLAVLNDIALCAEAMRNGIAIEKPMIVGTTSQAMQLIHDLNDLNQKQKLTQAEQDTKEVLIYNLKRDFEISPANDTLKADLEAAIANVTEGKTLKHEDLSELNKKIEIHRQQRQLSALINNDHSKNLLSKQTRKKFDKIMAGNPLEQKKFNTLLDDIRNDLVRGKLIFKERSPHNAGQPAQ